MSRPRKIHEPLGVGFKEALEKITDGSNLAIDYPFTKFSEDYEVYLVLVRGLGPNSKPTESKEVFSRYLNTKYNDAKKSSFCSKAMDDILELLNNPPAALISQGLFAKKTTKKHAKTENNVLAALHYLVVLKGVSRPTDAQIMEAIKMFQADGTEIPQEERK